MIIDADGLILGRMATVVAKRALEGEDIFIVNCDKTIITGDHDQILARQKIRKEMGHHKRGPFYYRNPDFFVKRSIRGMLPYKSPRGEAALKRIKCYVGVPDGMKGQKAETIKKAHLSSSQAIEYVTVGTICRLQGSKK